MSNLQVSDDLLYCAILESPEDDAPRLVYSDWLEEQGEAERAEFIRVQCKLWTGTWADQKELGEWRRRERELLAAHGQEGHPGSDWLEAVWPECWAVLPAPMADHYEFHRGFPSSITCTCADWLAVGRRLVWREGARCWYCNGTGLGQLGDGQCGLCRGTGKRDVRGCVPLERVTLSDKEPDHEEDNLWRWYTGYDAREAIPRELAKAMGQSIRTQGAFAMGNEAAFFSKAAALDALSAACLAWARGDG